MFENMFLPILGLFCLFLSFYPLYALPVFTNFVQKIGCEQIVTYASNNFYVPQLSVINYS